MQKHALALAVLSVSALLSGCSAHEDWPPKPRNSREQAIAEAARRAAREFDGWTNVACVIEQKGSEWRVQAWKIVRPDARGKQRCVPWAVRTIQIDSDGRVQSYENQR